MSRRGLIIRLLIFVPLFGYFGYGAIQKWRAEQAAAADDAPTSRKMQLPDGRTIDVIEMTPEQAEKHYGVKLPTEPTVSDASKPAPATKAGEGKSDANAPELKIELPAPAPASPPAN